MNPKNNDAIDILKDILTIGSLVFSVATLSYVAGDRVDVSVRRLRNKSQTTK